MVPHRLPAAYYPAAYYPAADLRSGRLGAIGTI